MPGISTVFEHGPYLGLVLLLFLGAFGFPFPVDATLILSGFFISAGFVQPLPTLPLVYVVLLGTDFTVFFLGRKYGRGIVTKGRFRKIVSVRRLSQLEKTFQRWGVLFIVLGRHIMILRAQIIIAAGIVRMPPLKFLAADAVTIPITMLLMVGAGYLGGSSLQALKKDMTRIEHWAVLLAAITTGIYIVYRRLSHKPE